MATLAERLREAREAKKLSRKEVGKKVGVSVQTISMWENGVTAPELDRLLKLADHYGRSLDWLLCRPTDDAGAYDPARTSQMAGIAHAFNLLPPSLQFHARAVLDALAGPYDPHRLQHEESLGKPALPQRSKKSKSRR